MAKAEASVEELVGMIQRGELRLPEMQRRYVWQSTRVRDLLDSLYRGYPSGAILLWETDEEVPLQEFSIQQQLSPYTTLRLLLDGQQRLTSLSAVIRGEPVGVRGRTRPIELLFNLDHPDELSIVTEVNEDSDDDMVEDEADSTDDDLQTRFNRMTFVVGTKKIERLSQWVRVSDVFGTNEDAPFLKRAGIENFDDPRYTKYSQRLAKLRGVRKYVYRMDVLERSMTYEEVTEIFVRVNSLGAKLRSSDLALAQVTSKWRGALAIFQEFEQECARAGFQVELGIHLRNMVAIATGQSRFLTIGGLPIERLQTAWEEAKQSMQFSLSFLRKNAEIDSPALLSSPYILVAIAYFGYKRDYRLSPEESVQLRQWVLLANAKGRYSRGSSESLLDQDLATLRDGGGATDLIDRLRSQVGRLDITPEELRGRNQRSSLFKTMFLAFRSAGAKDWSSSLAIALDHSGTQHKLQFNHIFAKAVLTRIGRTAREADDVANLAFVAGKTNRFISDRSPRDYLSRLRNESGAASLDAQAIPHDDALLEAGNYDQFLSRRRDLIADCLNLFLGTDGMGASEPNRDPYVRQLDARVEQVELSIRALVVNALDGDSALVPSHIAQKVNDRVFDAIRKNPAIAPGLDLFEARLHYCDFRELQDIVTAKTVWPRFEAVFGTKEAFNSRCGQLAELRNTIRHSRPMNDVTRKDGQAALSWFFQVLGLDTGPS
ncbi:MAG: DUF262 domain-containing protein [Jatrophihabitantaceae bacterium]